MLKSLQLKKDYLLIGATLLLLLISYRFAFKNTIDAWEVNYQLKAQLAHSSDIGYQPEYLERKNKNLETIFKSYKVDTISFRNNAVSTISLLAEKENVKLIDVPVQDIAYLTDRSIIQKLNFEGDFFGLTSLVNRLESTKDIGFIRSINWKKVETHGSTQEKKAIILELFMEIAK
ncbi:MAG: hypothetical protein EOP04_08710 [Proteobacteria bacterium]|nr:MAG: hypothetical protein EOP04_08710 [Pseudomonadota bacterium]